MAVDEDQGAVPMPAVAICIIDCVEKARVDHDAAVWDGACLDSRARQSS